MKYLVWVITMELDRHRNYKLMNLSVCIVIAAEVIAVWTVTLCRYLCKLPSGSSLLVLLPTTAGAILFSPLILEGLLPWLEEKYYRVHT